jgi:DNA mismatch repair protein MutL
MYIIDQHAANERINYEKFDSILNQNIQTSDLLIPYMVSLSPSDVMKLNENKINILKGIGLEVEIFGSSELKISKMPLFFKEFDEGSYIEEIINQVINKDRIDLSSLRKHVIATYACKASIKANQKLSIREMEDLINDLFNCENPTCCPHGRPTIIHFSKYDIEKMFKRSGI